ncbi:MAG: hypothetical protein K9L30_17255 [Desulfobacterales bacterium]|nr:hypothetical protein [Desulfobacterales bacterium]
MASTMLRTIYAFIRFLIEGKVLGYELLERKRRIRLPDRLPRAIEPEDIKQLLSVIDHVRDRAMILLLLITGLSYSGYTLHCLPISGPLFIATNGHIAGDIAEWIVLQIPSGLNHSSDHFFSSLHFSSKMKSECYIVLGVYTASRTGSSH